MSMSVRVFVHSCNSKTTRTNFTTSKFLLAAFGPGSIICPPLTALQICYVLPVLWTTSCFHTIWQMGQNPAWVHDVMFRRSSLGGGISWMSDNYIVWSSSSESSTGAKSVFYTWLVSVKYTDADIVYWVVGQTSITVNRSVQRQLALQNLQIKESWLVQYDCLHRHQWVSNYWTI